MNDGNRLPITSRLAIPLPEIELSFARSGGPGGQNVNKVASKVVLRFDVAGSPSLSAAQRARVQERLASRLTRRGELVLACDIHRDQPRNRAAVLARFRQLLAAAVTPPKRRVATKPSTAARERRLQEKKHRSRRKRGRSEAREWED